MGPALLRYLDGLRNFVSSALFDMRGVMLKFFLEIRNGLARLFDETELEVIEMFVTEIKAVSLGFAAPAMTAVGHRSVALGGPTRRR